MKKSLVCIFSILALVAAGNENKILNEAVDVYYGRNGAVCDKARAFQLFSEVAKNNNPHAFYWVGYCCIKGDGVEKNIAKGLEYYKKSADLGYANAQYAYAHWLYFPHKEVKRDRAAAFSYFKMAAEQNHLKALVFLGHCYRRGHGTPKNYQKAYECYRKAADQGNAVAQYQVGEAYFFRRGVSWDSQALFKYYSMAAAQKYPPALYRTGAAYSNGWGVPLDLAKPPTIIVRLPN